MTDTEIDTLKLKGMLGTRKALPQPDLCIEVFDVVKMPDGRTKGTIYCKQMKCEFPSGNLAEDVRSLTQEWLDLRDL